MRRGFTLLEALVAMAILGLVLAAALPLMAGGLRRQADAPKVVLALAQAENLLAGAGVATPLVVGRRQGVFQGLDWQLTVAPVPAMHNEARLAAFRVTAEVAHPRGAARVRLSTIKLQPRADRR